MQELVSIILPVYNGAEFLHSAIESCIEQSYDNIELIVIDDCSKDKTQEIVEYYCTIDDRIKYYRNPKNLKLPSCLNLGHNIASGDLVTWTSDDNIYSRDAIKKMVNRMFLDSVDIIYADMYIINEADKILRSQCHPRIENLIFHNQIGACFLYKKTVFNKLNGYRNLFLVEDYDFWLRALKYFTFSHIKEELYYYRIHKESLTNSISTSLLRKELYWKNLSIMFSDLILSLQVENPLFLKDFLINNILFREINFQDIKNNHHVLRDFTHQLSVYPSLVCVKCINRELVKILIQNLWSYSRANKFELSNLIFVFKNFHPFLGHREIKSLFLYFFVVLRTIKLSN